MNNWLRRLLIYSVSGILIRELQKDGRQRNMSVPEFKGVLEIKHALPGRIRVHVPIIQGNLDKVELLLTSFQKINGIDQIVVNPQLGTILVKYNENDFQPTLIIGIIIKLLNLEEAIQKQPTSLVNREITSIAEAVNSAVYNKTKGIVSVTDILFISLGVLGIYRIQGQQDSVVNGATLLWWAYSLLPLPK